MTKIKVQYAVFFIILFFITACQVPKHAYQAQEEAILNDLYNNENDARGKIALEYLLKAEQRLKVEQFKQAELVLLKAVEVNMYENLTSYYLAQTFFYLRRYNEALSYLKTINTAFKQYPRYHYLLQKLKGDVYFSLDQKKEALIAYKKCLNMHSEDEYVKERVEALKSLE
ncbi:tetratricopeptide repeat protein [bacterium]|nr:tetratricopeptide repeat protein [bacterium]